MLQPPPFSTDRLAVPAMSTECEAAPSQPLAAPPRPSASPHPAAAQAQERHGASGISYEGRVSVIPPLASYEATVRAALQHAGEQHLQHPDRTFGGAQIEQDLRRLYEHRLRLHEASQAYDAARQACEIPREACLPKEEPPSEQEGEGSVRRGEEAVHASHGEPSPQASHSQVKEEPREAVTEAVEGQQTVFSKSPINKAGESPDLPTGATEDQYTHNDAAERMSPYDDSDAHMPPSVEQDGEDTMDSMEPGMDGDMDHLSRLQQAMELSGVMSGKDEGGSGSGNQMFQCHMCSYSCAARHQFNTHLNTHYDHKCTKCEFITHAESKLHEHLQEEHGLDADSPEDMEGVRVPRVNAQGKVKTFKCKQCEYVAITKGDFWAHARSHIKSEKLLTCPKCPFVTEYKHHLEYHLRNHFGSKPFKCNKCNYSCVNKSMLNSHMKSHSNIYQYRCSDCTYATKYCHSLKLHLRKYGHNPAMVLNPDGTPNPIPIIDVYGTRRGPKLKKDEKGMPILPPHYQLQAQLLKVQMQANNAIPPAPPVPPVDKPSTKGASRKAQPLVPVSMPPISAPHSPFPYPYPGVMDTFQSSSPILSRALEKSPEEPRPLEGREHLRELLLERERAAAQKPLSPGEGLRCTLCDHVAEGREAFSQHMMAHAASEQREDTARSPRRSPPVAMDHCSSASPDHRPASPPRPTLFPHQAPPPLPPPLPAEASHMYGPLAAAHNLKEYLARAMNPFLYQQMVGGQIHPAFGLQQHLQQFTHPTFPGPRPLLPMEEDPHLQSPQPQIQARPQSPLPQPESQPQPQPQGPLTQPLSPTTEGVLDLSKEQTLQQMCMAKEQTPPQQVRNTSKEPPPLQQRESRQSISPNHSSPQSASPPRSETSTPPSKNRRKGRAFKLERIALRLSESAEGESSGHDEDARREDEESPDKGGETRLPPLLPLPHGDSPEGPPQEVWGGAHHCQFCDMAFKDVVMYTMHMGYHGYRNPFTCNMCGHQAADKVAFFLHIARSSHS